MRKMTPMILVALMLASIFASIDFAELEETVVIDEAGARTGADAETIAITSPKETSCTMNGCRNQLKVGEVTTFAAFIKNSGDAAIEEMGYSVTVYLDDGDGNAGMISKDLQGNDLSWENGDVICDSVIACPVQSLAAGAILGGGKTTLQYGGQDIQWTPIAGDYIVEVVVNALDDADPGNDVQQITVSVINWVDIAIELSWDANDDGNDVMTGPGPHDFTLTVTSNGSADNGFNPRTVSVELKISGDLESAQNVTGGDILGTHTVIAGTSGQTVETFRHGEDPNNVTNDVRTVLNYQTTWTYQGSILPSDVVDNAAYSIEASLENYVDYDAFESCWETFSENNSENGTTETTYYHMCEEVQNSDDYPNSNRDAITGYTNNYHDIRITTLTVYQGYNSDGTGEPTYSLSDGQTGDLNVGTSRVHVQVEHRGSSIGSLYHWNVTFTITKEGGPTSTTTVGDCMNGVPPAYEHAQLGEDPTVQPPELFPSLTGFACDIITLQEGTYTFEADLTMDKITDQRPSNNHKSVTFDVVNNLPMITSFDLNTIGDLVVGQEEFLQMSVQAFDVDEPSGESLVYTWAYQGGALPGCGGAANEGGTTCQFPIIQLYVTLFAVTVTVTDSQNASVSEEMMLEIWNNAEPTATTTSNIEVKYAIQYFLPGDFTITAEDGDLAAFEDKELPGYTGTYDAIGVVVYAPGTTYTAEDILTQSMTVIFEKSLGATSLWYVTDSGLWVSMSTTAEDVDGTTSKFEVSIPDNSPVLPAGSLVLIGAALAEEAVPVASISAFDASAGKGGALIMNWNVSTILLTSDYESITISCDTANADCDEADFPFTTNAVPGTKAYTYSGTNTAHGMEYNVSVAICNAPDSCSTPIGAGTIVADKAVDGGVSANNLAVQEVGEEWTVSWTETGELFDVDHWNVCYQKQDSFDAANMPSQCVSTTSATDMTINIAKPTAEGTWEYYFTAVPVDALGNSESAASLNSIAYDREVTITDPGDGGTVGTGSGSDGVPGWTWALIGGLLLVAVVVSAGILRRGDDGDDENKDWDY